MKYISKVNVLVKITKRKKITERKNIQWDSNTLSVYIKSPLTFTRSYGDPLLNKLIMLTVQQ